MPASQEPRMGGELFVLSVITMIRWSGCGRLNVIGTKALILVRDRERDKKKTQNLSRTNHRCPQKYVVSLSSRVEQRDRYNETRTKPGTVLCIIVLA